MNQIFYKNSTDKKIDTPFEDDPKYQCFNTLLINKHDVDTLENAVKYADGMDKHIYKKHGLNLLWATGIAYIIMVLFDTIITNVFSWQTSELMHGLIELLKFLVSTLMGYVFCETSKKDK